MLKPKEDMKWLEDKFEGATIFFVLPLLILIDQFHGLGKSWRTFAMLLTGLFFWIGLIYSGHVIIKFLVETFVHV